MKRALALALALAACSPQAPADPPQPAAQEEVAPRIVSIRINFAQNGQSIEAPVGEPFSIELPDDGSLGLAWQIQQTPEFISPAPEGSVTTPPEEESAPPAPGLPGRRVFFFVATAAGAGELVLEQRNFDGSEDAGGEQFRVTIIAR